MKNKKKYRILPYIVIAYMLMALLWWAILLHKKNKEVFELNVELLEQRHFNSEHTHKLDITTLIEYKTILSKYERQSNMIYGEALVFCITLIIGIYFINRAFSRELQATAKQNNFLLSITHELKTPLAAINLALSTFTRGILSNDQILELSEESLKEVTRLENLFNKILTATRIKQAYNYNFEKLNLSNLLQDSILSFERLYPNFKIESLIQNDILAKVDKEAMISLFNNLLENAWKYGGEPPVVRISLGQSENGIIIQFDDNGFGIPKEEAQRVFGQFYRIGNENTRKSKGTGLGLYIVHQVVLAHKGKIRIEKNERGGSNFIISLDHV